MDQEEGIELKPWEESLDEEYWLALLQQGEHQVGDGSLDRDGPLWHESDQPQDSTDRPSAEQTLEEKTSPPAQDTLAALPSWELAEAHLCDGVELTLPVIDHNRGGLIVDWHGWQGFVPASHLILMPSFSSEQDRRNHLAARVGEQLQLQIIELDRDRNRLILSEKAAALQENDATRLLDDICAGDILQGCITNLCSFGAFVDLGGVEGLIHISELSWGRVAHPSDVLNIGQEVDVYVLNVERTQQRIGLSLKRLLPDPWSSLEDRYYQGQLVQGQITNVVSFGAFARIEEGVEGLIHVSELAEGDFLHPRNVVQEGETVTVRIVNIDSVNHRLGLSLRHVDDQAGGDGMGDLSLS